MADFLSTGVSALQAFQRALDVTSQNIANVATDGYSRQTPNLVTNQPQPFSNGWVGSGVSVNTITRSYSDTLTQQVRSSSSSYQSSNEFATGASQIDDMFSDSSTGLSATLQKFSSAVQDMANSPSASAPRQVVLSQAQALADQLHQYDNQLTTLGSQIDARVKTTAATITSLAQGIAKLNTQIAQAGANGQPPNDLLDQRDRLVDQLSSNINVNVTTQDNGVVNVYIGNGQPLVVGTSAATLSTVPNAFNSTRSDIVLTNGNSTATNITASITGGTLGGMLDFRNQMLDPARNSLGLISIGLADAVNQQQHAGLDLNGNLGQDIFAVGAVQVQSNAGNTGPETLAVTRTNVSALTSSDYLLTKTAGGWTLSNASTGANVALSGAGTALSPLQADGLSIVVSGAATTGDRFLIQPTVAATAGLNVVLSDPSQIAAAAPVRSSAATTNTGNATISKPAIVSAANPQLQATTTIQFLTATTYSINGVGSNTYTPGQAINLNGWSVSISGTPAAGDSFTVASNAGATGDNSNALLLAAAFDQKNLSGGTDSVNTSLGRLIGNLGTVTQQAQNDSAAQKAVNASATQSRSNVSGVNLDEEAANLLRYQQAYQAAAHLISVASTLFDTLLAASRGQ